MLQLPVGQQNYILPAALCILVWPVAHVIKFFIYIVENLGQRSGLVVSTVASQQEGPGFDTRLR